MAISKSKYIHVVRSSASMAVRTASVPYVSGMAPSQCTGKLREKLSRLDFRNAALFLVAEDMIELAARHILSYKVDVAEILQYLIQIDEMRVVQQLQYSQFSFDCLCYLERCGELLARNDLDGYLDSSFSVNA